MSISLNQTLPALAAVCTIAFGVIRATQGNWRRQWWEPASLCAAFLGWSLYAMMTEGPLGFWPEHVRNSWGNQIFIDLLIAASTAFALLVPRARAAGMKPLPWFVLIACTGSIGLLAMVARCMFLEREARPPS
jgi:Na+-transporting NADH:ubiquinone oxidoreductase subunit NqrB